MKLLYYLAAIGPHHYEKKIDLFFKNIQHITGDDIPVIDVMINMYEDNQCFIDSIHMCKQIDKVYIHKRKGVLAELWKTNPYHNVVKNYDIVLFILDDIELENISIKKMLEVKNKHQIDIISPRVRNSTQKWLMDSFDEREYLRLVNMIEIYTILITPDIFYRFMEINDIDNKWIWGVDALLGHFGFKCGIYNDAHVLHHFPNNSDENKKQAHSSMMRYIKKHGYEDINHIIDTFPMIKLRLKRDIVII